MSKHAAVFIFLVFCFSITAFGQTHTAQNSTPKLSGKKLAVKPHNSVFFTVGREGDETVTIDVAFHAGEGKISIGDREISVQLLSVKRTADGKVDDVTKVGTPVKVNMPAADIDASGGDKAAPKITVRFVPGADAMNISVKDVASGTVKNVLLRVPPGQGTTMGEMRF